MPVIAIPDLSARNAPCSLCPRGTGPCARPAVRPAAPPGRAGAAPTA